MRERGNRSFNLHHRADSCEQTILVCLANKGFLVRVGETSRGGWRRSRREEKARRGGKQGRNYYIFCPKARIAPFAELRDRDSADDCGRRMPRARRGSPRPFVRFWLISSAGNLLQFGRLCERPEVIPYETMDMIYIARSYDENRVSCINLLAYCKTTLNPLEAALSYCHLKKSFLLILLKNIL